MAKIVKGKYPYKDDKKELKKIEERLNAEEEFYVKMFADNEKKNVIHGSNTSAYKHEFKKPFRKELEVRKEKLKAENIKRYCNALWG